MEATAPATAAAQRLRAQASRLLPVSPDVVFAFNPGFTCPVYGWEDTLTALCSR